MILMDFADLASFLIDLQHFQDIRNSDFVSSPFRALFNSSDLGETKVVK